MEFNYTEIFDWYSFENPRITFIRHSEHIIYLLEDYVNKYIVRIHQPIDGFSLDIHRRHFTDTEYINGEMNVLEELSSNSKLSVSKPIKNKEGKYVTYLKDATLVTVLSWIDGDDLTKVSPTKRIAYNIGVLLSNLRRSGNICEDLKIYYFNSELIDMMIEELKEAYLLNHLSEHQYSILITTLETINKEIKRLDKVPDSFGLIHADFGLGNIIMHNDTLSLIDFSFCGYGHFNMDLGFAVSNFKEIELRRALINGYEESLGIRVDIRSVESFFVFGVILYITSQHKKIYKENWFQGNMERWERTLFKPLNKQISFLFSDNINEVSL